MPFVYILRSLKDGALYTGSTSDLYRRLQEHAKGQSRSTRHRRPLELVYYEEHKSLGAAGVREKELKKATLGKTKETLIAAFPSEKLKQFKTILLGRGASA